MAMITMAASAAGAEEVVVEFSEKEIVKIEIKAPRNKYYRMK
jgi:hypothetical protein